MLILQVDLCRVATVCSLIVSLLCGNKDKPSIDNKMDLSKLLPLICTTFLFAYVWGVGGNLVEKSMDTFDSFCRDLFGDTHDVKVGPYHLISLYQATGHKPLFVEIALYISVGLQGVTTAFH